jgi:putative ABC transport system substrate-binding protein
LNDCDLAGRNLQASATCTALFTALNKADGNTERRPAVAAEMVRRQVTVMVTDGTLFAQVAKSATQTIPIVFLAGGDPVEFGLVTSLNRPGGNVTGISLLGADITTKRLDLLHKLVPTASLIAMLVGSASSQFTSVETRGVQSAADALGVRVVVLNAGTESEIAPAFATLVGQGGQRLVGWRA